MSGKAKKWTAALVRQKCKKVGDCLIWNGRVDPCYGHPIASVNGRSTCMRPYYFTKLLGREVPPGHVVSPVCGNKLCMSCLEARTRGQVLTAAYQNGLREADSASRLRRTMARKGTKLTLKQADEIRASKEPAKVLAARYGVGEETVRSIWRGTRWAKYRPVANASVFDWASFHGEAA